MPDSLDLNIVLKIVWNALTGEIDMECDGPQIPIHYQHFNTLFQEVFRLIKLQADKDGMLFSNKEKTIETLNKEEDISLWIRKVISNDNN